MNGVTGSWGRATCTDPPLVSTPAPKTLHFAIIGAPRVIRNPARAIDGPAMFPDSRVEFRGIVRIGRRAFRSYYVPPALNDGSAFGGHLVLVWVAGGHTYAYGFHVVYTYAAARALNAELVRHLTIVKP